jgi:predicted nucleotidyltransferase
MKGSIETRVKETVDKVIPEARVILYGSRARGDHREGSDWDFLILTPQVPDFALQDQVREALYTIELESGEVITSLFEQKDRWTDYAQTVFFENISREGIEITRPEPA